MVLNARSATSWNSVASDGCRICLHQGRTPGHPSDGTRHTPPRSNTSPATFIASRSSAIPATAQAPTTVRAPRRCRLPRRCGPRDGAGLHDGAGPRDGAGPHDGAGPRDGAGLSDGAGPATVQPPATDTMASRPESRKGADRMGSGGRALARAALTSRAPAQLTVLACGDLSGGPAAGRPENSLTARRPAAQAVISSPGPISAQRTPATAASPATAKAPAGTKPIDRKSTRLNSSH